MADQAHALSLSQDGDIAIITFDTPNARANLMSESVVRELSDILDQVQDRKDIAGLIFRSGKPGMFIAGADLKVLGSFPEPNPALAEKLSTEGREVLRRLRKVPFVTVAAVEGACAGGGAELSLWCDRRVFSNHKSTQWGCPEVKVGILPGWGGTQLMPRMLGIFNAIELCCGGELINAVDAYKMGVATDLVDSELLLDAAKAVIRAESESGEWKKDREELEEPIVHNPEQDMFTMITTQGYIMQTTKGQYPAPLKIMEVILEGSKKSLDDGLKLESKGFGELMGSPISNALIHVFFMTDRMKKDRGVADETVRPQGIESVGVVGSGIMGHGIAAASIKRNFPVVLLDADADALAKGAKKALEIASFDKSVRGPSADKLVDMAPRLKATTDIKDFADRTLVIEAITEKIEVKKALFQQIEPLVRPDAFLASNTSTISITEMAKVLDKPERFCGIHFFNPVHKMQLVEVIRGEKTSDETVATAVAFVQKLGKLPIVVKDGAGFLVNRILLPYMGEACALLEDGASIKDVDKAAKKFGMPMGPITLYDVVGIDTTYYAGFVMAAAFPDRVIENKIIAALVEKGRFGQKTGKGFFAYPKGNRGVDDPEVDKLIASVRTSDRKVSRDEITDRLFLPMIVEATRILEEGLVRDPRDVDSGTIYGFGFPPFRGGLLKYADALGADEILRRLEPLAELGARFQPTEMLRSMAKAGKKFYG